MMRFRSTAACFLIVFCSTSGGVAAQTTLEFWWQSDEVMTPFARKTVELFERANSDVRVNLRIYSNEAYKTAIQIAAASSHPPDLFYNWPGEDTGRLVRAGLVEEMTSYAERFGWQEVLAEGALDAFTYDGRLFGAPYQQESKYFFYNKELFEREDLQQPGTFEELLGLCRTIRRRKLAPIAPIAFGNSERWPASHYLTILNQKTVGEKRLREDYTMVSPRARLFADPGYVEALQALRDMQQAGCFNDAVNAMSPEVARALFYTDQAPLVFCGTWCIGIMKRNDFEGKYGLFRMPRVEGGRGNQNYVVTGPTGILVSSRSRHKEAAARFVDFWLSEASQQRFATEVGRLPARVGAVDPDKVPEALAWVAADLPVADGSVLWIDVALDARVVDVYLNATQEVLNGTKTPEQAMDIVRQEARYAQQRKGM